MAEIVPRPSQPPDVVPGVAHSACGECLAAGGADEHDPVGWRVIEAMTRRLDALRGPARAALTRRIERRLAALRTRRGRADSAHPAPAQDGPLAALLEHLARQAGAAAADGDVAGAEACDAAELKSVRRFRSTWSRLRLEQQLARACAAAPDNAGPLNSQHLSVQALIRMRDIAPAYLEAFICQVDALLWLQQVDAMGGAGPRITARKGEARSAAARAGRTRKAPPAGRD